MSIRVGKEAPCEDQNLLFTLSSEKERLASFKNWPFDSKCNCTPAKMAAAGFYHCPTDTEPDAVRCFMCMKELDGWEPQDEPMEEHKSHSKDCPYLKMTPENEMTVADFLTMEMKRQVWKIKRAKEEVEKEFRYYAEATRHEMEKLADDY